MLTTECSQIVKNSKLNVEVKEFKPKKTIKSEEPTPNFEKSKIFGITNENLSQSTDVSTTENVDKRKLLTTSNLKKRQSSSTGNNKKFIFESTKNIELQNIDLKKTTESYVNNENELEWVIIGGKKKVVESTKSCTSTQKTTETPNSPVSLNDKSENSDAVPPATFSKKSKKSRSKSNRGAKKGKDKAGKLEGFVIEEPKFHSNEINTKEIVNNTNATDDEDEADDELIIQQNEGSNYDTFTVGDEKDILDKREEDLNSEIKELDIKYQDVQQVQVINLHTSGFDNKTTKSDSEACTDNTAFKSNEIKETDLSEVKVNDALNLSPTLHLDTENKTYVTMAVTDWLSKFDAQDIKSLFTIPLNADFVKKIKYCSEISNLFDDDYVFENENVLQQHPFYQYKLVAESDCLSTSSEEYNDSDTSSNNVVSSNNRLGLAYKTTKRYFGCETM